MLPNLRIDIQDVNALSLTIIVKRLNPYTERTGNIYAPRFPKSQTEGWFVVLCREDRDEIIALKRVGIAADGKGRGAKLSAKAEIKLPEEEGGGFKDGRKCDVWVVSDGYVGMMYKVSAVEIPDVPRVVDDGKKMKEKESISGAGGS
jgi:antiviral helicase SLH1